MQRNPIINRLKLQTPAGVVHLVVFKKGSCHRETIFKILSDLTGRTIGPENLVQHQSQDRPSFPNIDFDVNWTHSGDVCVLAYAETSKIRVGVDLEFHKSNKMDLAERFFDVHEVDYLKKMSKKNEEMATAMFYRLWCKKEALYKCIGGSFFEGTLRRNVMEDSLEMEIGKVHFVNLDETSLQSARPASLCVAVKSIT